MLKWQDIQVRPATLFKANRNWPWRCFVFTMHLLLFIILKLKNVIAFSAYAAFVRSQTGIEKAKLLLIQLDDYQSDLFIDFLRVFKSCTEDQHLFRVHIKTLNPVQTETEICCDTQTAFYLGENQT